MVKWSIKNPATGELDEVEPMIRKLEDERDKITDRKSTDLRRLTMKLDILIRIRSN